MRHTGCFFNMMGKFATVIGPPMMGLVGALTGSSRLAILSLVLLFLGGGILLHFARVPNEGQGVAG